MWHRAIVAFLLLLVMPVVSHAYLCSMESMKKDVPARLKEADLVFRGSLTSLEPVDSLPPRGLPRRFVATFRVTARWKGPAASVIRAFTYEDREDALLVLEVGGDYLIFARVVTIDASTPGWRDVVPAGTQAIFPNVGCGQLSGPISWSIGTLRELGEPLKP